MNIKTAIKSQRIRHFLMKCGWWLPDSLMVSIQYYLICHRWPDLKNPVRFSEKIQWYKLHYRKQVMRECVDKYTVRHYVERKMGNTQILNQLYQVCDNADEIEFDKLPNKFVIKTTNGGNGDNILIVKNKSNITPPHLVDKINQWKERRYDIISREWAYKGLESPRIIVEQYLEENHANGGSLNDYKFLCFNGKFKYLWVDLNRYTNHTRGWWNEKLQYLNIDSIYPGHKGHIALPENIDEMIRIAETLASDFPFVRVDLYNVDGKIYFGELTFYPQSGYIPFKPDSFDFELGAEFSLPENTEQ